jgi:hypothetical protein
MHSEQKRIRTYMLELQKMPSTWNSTDIIYHLNSLNKAIISICALVSARQPFKPWILCNPAIQPQ